MRVILIYSLFLLFMISSCESPTSSNNDQIFFKTVGDSFSVTDSIKVILENRTDLDYKIALRCGSYLEMYYQKKGNDIWSKQLWFSWMTLKCSSVLSTLDKDSAFQFVIPSNEIGISGTYRLLLSNDTLVTSNSFEIK